MQGWRADMEDAHAALLQIDGPGPPPPPPLPPLPPQPPQPPPSDCAFFGVFDGHAGGGAAAHCAAHLLDSVRQTDGWANGRPGDALRTGFLQHDEKLRTGGAAAGAGCTAVVALIEPTRLWLANCGDSRAIVCRGGAPALWTKDHKPACPDEARRIRRAGGAVLLSRVNGSLAVSRALGDFAYKRDPELDPCEQLVSPEPDVLCWERDLSQDQFLLLACDGLWDVLSNEDACSYVTSLLRISGDLVEVTNRLVDACLAKGSDDNISVVLVTFPAAPTPSQDARRADHELEETIRKCITVSPPGLYHHIYRHSPSTAG
ncbi:protein phosphatase 1A-like isoform X2 [Arctopsyche grandis]|uniref:protein phosphatase 1A-like isoform X2 n=1 Tax=Arctopsyche grandis TaxID=121162 RepID=UPI00406D9CDF